MVVYLLLLRHLPSPSTRVQAAQSLVSLSINTKAFLTGETVFDDMAIANQKDAEAEKKAATCILDQQYICTLVGQPVVSFAHAADVYPKKGTKPWTLGGKQETCGSLGLLVAYGVAFVVANGVGARAQQYVVVRTQADDKWSTETRAKINEVVIVATGKSLQALMSACQGNVRTFKITDVHFVRWVI